MDTPPAWLQTFLDRLAADDLSQSATPIILLVEA